MTKGYSVIRTDENNKPIEACGIFPTMEQAMKQSAAVGNRARIGIVYFEIVSVSFNPDIVELDSMGVEVIII